MLPSVKIIIKYSVTYPHFRGVNGHFQVKCAKYSNTHTTVLRLSGFWLGQPGWAGTIFLCFIFDLIIENPCDYMLPRVQLQLCVSVVYCHISKYNDTSGLNQLQCCDMMCVCISDDNAVIWVISSCKMMWWCSGFHCPSSQFRRFCQKKFQDCIKNDKTHPT